MMAETEYNCYRFLQDNTSRSKILKLIDFEQITLNYVIIPLVCLVSDDFSAHAPSSFKPKICKDSYC